VGWYIEMNSARSDPTLKPFEGLSDSELATSSEFFQAMTKPAAYDRTIFIKLAMTLKTDLIIEGLVTELGITRRHAVSAMVYHKIFRNKIFSYRNYIIYRISTMSELR
jgi:hypothetical protein